MKNQKIILFSFLLLFTSFLYGFSPDFIQEFTLDNGLKVFLIQDNSSALLRVEAAVKAGFSSQTQETSGFFKLYSNLVKASCYNFSFSDVQCNSDSSRYILNLVPSELEDTLDELSQKILSPQFSDELISSELSSLKKEVEANSQDLTYFINSSIDSRVFLKTPWKHDSGIYPSLFAKTTVSKARNLLDAIAQGWYTPQNTALFISGNLNIFETLNIVQNTFGRFYSSSGKPQEQSSYSENSQKKYVIHHKELSPDLTQVVVQFTQLDMEECRILSAMFNSSSSTLKNLLLSESRLNIPGDEYINIAAASKSNSSRLIIQALLQAPEDKNIKINAAEQTELFVNLVLQAFDNTSEEEFNFYRQMEASSFDNLFENSSVFMENLSQFWAVENYSPASEEELDDFKNSITAARMLSVKNKLLTKDFLSIKKLISALPPYVFSIIDTKRFNSCKKSFTEYGYEEVNSKNSSWYMQKLYANLENSQMEQTDSIPDSEDKSFYSVNSSSITEYNLHNGIPLVTKYNDLTSSATVLIKINGGKINSQDNHGFEEVMINLLTAGIRNEIYKKQYEGIISGNPSLSAQTDLDSSAIILECQKEDMQACMKAVSDALIYGELIPSLADRTVANRQYKKRMENGSTQNQMFAGIIRQLYGNSSLYSIYETQKDVLENTKFEDFVAAYPDFLDASRYSLVVTGNFNSNILEIMDQTMGVLSGLKTELKTVVQKPDFPSSKNLKVKINHTFLTDIPKEKAGPMPSVLIPTTEFLDPVMYVIEAPKEDSRNYAVFNALVLYMSSLLQTQVNRNSRLQGAQVSARFATKDFPFAVLVINEVKHTKECDAEYKLLLKNLMNSLSSSGESLQTVEKIRNLWIKDQLSQTITNSGTALLIYESLVQSCGENPKLYLDNYKKVDTAGADSYIQLLLNIPSTPVLRVYSTDSKN